jgi:hypothetical protein
VTRLLPDACPECERGRVIEGPYDRDTGRHTYWCSLECGWTG